MKHLQRAWYFAKIALPALVLALLAFAAVLTASEAMASEEIAQAEGGVACTVCHDKPGSKLYTDRGKFYEATGSLEGFDEVIQAFRACTTCHVKKPGSQKFTPQGKRFVGVMEDMTELRDWAMKAHPPTEDVKMHEVSTDGDPAAEDAAEDDDAEDDDAEDDDAEADAPKADAETEAAGGAFPMMRSSRR